MRGTSAGSVAASDCLTVVSLVPSALSAVRELAVSCLFPAATWVPRASMYASANAFASSVASVRSGAVTLVTMMSSRPPSSVGASWEKPNVTSARASGPSPARLSASPVVPGARATWAWPWRRFGGTPSGLLPSLSRVGTRIWTVCCQRSGARLVAGEQVHAHPGNGQQDDGDRHPPVAVQRLDDVGELQLSSLCGENPSDGSRCPSCTPSGYPCPVVRVGTLYAEEPLVYCSHCARLLAAASGSNGLYSDPSPPDLSFRRRRRG